MSPWWLPVLSPSLRLSLHLYLFILSISPVPVHFIFHGCHLRTKRLCWWLHWFSMDLSPARSPTAETWVIGLHNLLIKAQVDRGPPRLDSGFMKQLSLIGMSTAAEDHVCSDQPPELWNISIRASSARIESKLTTAANISAERRMLISFVSSCSPFKPKQTSQCPDFNQTFHCWSPDLDVLAPANFLYIIFMFLKHLKKDIRRFESLNKVRESKIRKFKGHMLKDLGPPGAPWGSPQWPPGCDAACSPAWFGFSG